MRHHPGVSAPLLADDPRIRLHLHGSAHARGPAQQVMPLRGRAAALVALAALEPGGIARERAALMLWPDAPSPRQNLRQQLLRFRQALGQALIEGDDILRPAPGVLLEPPAPGAELLADEAAGNDDFGLWLAAQRRQRVQAEREPLLQALAAAEASGELDQALAQAQALLAADAGDEAHHAALMRVHYLRGEAAAGLAVHERLCSFLASRYGTQPSAATQALAAALRRAGTLPPPAAAVAGGLPVTLKRPPVLAGRAAERAAVRSAWAEGRAVVIEGDAGMGKSRLIAECLADRRAAGARGLVLHAAARPGDTGAPYNSLARLLRPLLEQPPAGLSEPVRDALARISPAASAPAAAAALPAGAMPAAVEAALGLAGVETVVLDDLHFADAATLELLAGLASAESPRRWLFAQRAAEAPAAAVALRDALLELQRGAVVALAPLDEPAAAELVDALAVPGLHGATLAPALVRHSGGNPLFLLESLKQGLVDGSLARGELPRPASVDALIERRLRRLSEPALALARVAAVAGVDFRIELAESAIGQSAVQLASAWQELQDAQVLRDEAFAHDLVADAVLRRVPPVVARRVHGQCAAWLEAHGGEPARVARHWVAGGRPAAAARAFEQAAQRAHVAARQAEEADLYAQAAAAHAAAGEPAARFEALARRVSALIGARADEAALAEARALPDQAHDDLQRVRAYRVMADLMGQRGPFDAALEVGEQGMALARRIGAQEELARLAALTAGNLCKLGRPQDAYSLMLPLREWAEASADADLGLVWHGYWAAVLGHIGRLREGVASFDRAYACAERSHDRPGQSMALLNQCVVLRTMGALDRAFEGSRRGLALAPDAADSASHRLARLMHARNEAETGRFAAAQQALNALLPQFEAMGAAFWVQATRQTQARLWQHLGQHARALQALALEDDGMPSWMRAGRLWVRLEVEQWRGLPVAADGVAQALALLEGDAHRRAGNAVRALRFEEPAAVLARAPALDDEAAARELFGVRAALQMAVTRAALALQRQADAKAAAVALRTLLEQGYSPDFTYAPEAWLVAGLGLQAGGDTQAAQAAWTHGLQWVRGQALPQVPPPFIDSFLNRNPVNRELLALGGGGRAGF